LWEILVNVLSFVLAVFLVTVLTCCASSKKEVKIPTYEEAKKQVLAEGNLVDPPVEKKYKFLQGGKAAGVKSGTKVTVINPDNTTKDIDWGAVILNEKKAAELRAIKVQRDRALKDLKAERLRRRTKEIIYKASLEAMRLAAKRTWWERNHGIVYFIVGGALGAGIITGIVYALTKGNGVTVNTNAHLLLPSGVRR
jgi:hypothetical protein